MNNTRTRTMKAHAFAVSAIVARPISAICPALIAPGAMQGSRCDRAQAGLLTDPPLSPS